MNDRLSADLASLRIDRSGPKPPNKILRGAVTLAAIAAVGIAAVKVGEPWISAQVFQVEVGVTEIAAISPVQAQVDLTATGYVVPQITAKVGAKVVGRVQRAKVREGEAVKAGQVLFELDSIEQAAAVASARARVAAANAKVLTAKAQRAEVDADFKRQKQLAEGGAVSRAVVEDLERRLTSLDAQIKAAEADVAAAGAEVDSLATILRSLVITAPIDGVAMTKPATVGDIASPGVPLVELADFGSLLVEVDVPEARLALVKPGGPCDVALDALPDRRLRGVTVETGPRLNRAKATATVKVKVEDAPPDLRPEMSARVSFLQKPLDAAALTAPPKIVVPQAAVIDRAGGKAVWVVDAGKVRLVNVVVGETFGTGFVLKQGPPPGTRIVKDPPAVLSDGKSVKEKTS
ncbi:MAG: efflux RND transporter periplasmic adaptor subunit [Byssovorax sp.]